MNKTILREEHIELHGVPATRIRYAPAASGGYEPSAVYVDGCVYCDREKDAGETFFPSHFAGSNCRSGKYPHCTCDGCF